jgi:hypothetical protein
MAVGVAKVKRIKGLVDCFCKSAHDWTPDQDDGVRSTASIAQE